MKNIIWLGTTYRMVKDCSINVRREIGYNLDRVQRGLDPCDWKPIIGAGSGVKEIRIHEGNEYRGLYVLNSKKLFTCCIVLLRKLKEQPKKRLILQKNIMLKF